MSSDCVTNDEKRNVSIFFVFVSKIGPDFSPDIQALQRLGLQPLGHALFFTGMVLGKRRHVPGAKAHFVVVLNAQAKAWAYLRSKCKNNSMRYSKFYGQTGV